MHGRRFLELIKNAEIDIRSAISARKKRIPTVPRNLKFEKSTRERERERERERREPAKSVGRNAGRYVGK